MNRTGIPDNCHPVWPVPDQEPVDVACLTPAVRAAWITPELVNEVEGS